LRCAAVCCGVLRCVVCCYVMQSAMATASVVRKIHCSTLQQSLQHTLFRYCWKHTQPYVKITPAHEHAKRYTATHCNTLQHTATHCKRASCTEKHITYQPSMCHSPIKRQPRSSSWLALDFTHHYFFPRKSTFTHAPTTLLQLTYQSPMCHGPV